MTRKKALLLLSLTGLLSITSPVMSANAAWKTTTAGKIYTQTASPGYVTGWKIIDNKKYYFNSKGVLQTGFQTIDKKLYYFGTDGVLQYGWITVGTKKYYANGNTGALATEAWIGNYYFHEDGTMAVNEWIYGKWVGPTGKYTGVNNNVGWIIKNGKTYYYDTNGNLVKNWLNLNGKTYYLQSSTGALLTGWIKVSGKTYYAEPKKGEIQKNKWVDNKHLGRDGVMDTGLTKIGSNTYYLSDNGTKQTGWIKLNDEYYYFSKKGVLQKNKWVDGNKYVTAKGTRARNFVDIKGKTYYFNPSTGERLTSWQVISGKRYYFSTKSNPKGQMLTSQWRKSKTFYLTETGECATGVTKIGKYIYYFDTKTYKKQKNLLKTSKGATYYLQANGCAVTSKWYTLNGSTYYFDENGKMAKSTWVDGYYVGADGKRTSQTKQEGWVTISGKKYYFDKDGNMATGWKTISGSKYYFSTTGAMLTGLQTIADKTYYFYTTGQLATSVTIVVGAKQYTINSKGVVTKTENLSIKENTTGDKIVNFALKYVGNPYVYGGTNLTKGADCSGFTYTVFRNFKISLLRTADQQMKGPNSSEKSQGYKAAVVVDMNSLKPGDLLFYGSSSYATHVGIYIGNGKIVHASNSQPYPAGGIKISSYDYTTPVKAVRYWY